MADGAQEGNGCDCESGVNYRRVILWLILGICVGLAIMALREIARSLSEKPDVLISRACVVFVRVLA
jgi:hypothetical protein